MLSYQPLNPVEQADDRSPIGQNFLFSVLTGCCAIALMDYLRPRTRRVVVTDDQLNNVTTVAAS